jgi:hypothetical protein
MGTIYASNNNELTLPLARILLFLKCKTTKNFVIDKGKNEKFTIFAP